MKDMVNGIKNNKFLRGIFVLVKIILYVVLIGLLFVVVVQKVTKNNFSIGGVKVFTVVTGSMKPEYVEGDMLISKKVLSSEINVGDNVVYRGEKGDMAGKTVTHKVMEVREENGVTYYVTKGSANEFADPEISYNQVYGKIVCRIPILSELSRLMLNVYAYYILTTIMGLLVSIQLVRVIYDKDEDEK